MSLGDRVWLVAWCVVLVVAQLLWLGVLVRVGMAL